MVLGYKVQDYRRRLVVLGTHKGCSHGESSIYLEKEKDYNWSTGNVYEVDG